MTDEDWLHNTCKKMDEKIAGFFKRSSSVGRAVDSLGPKVDKAASALERAFISVHTLCADIASVVLPVLKVTVVVVQWIFRHIVPKIMWTLAFLLVIVAFMFRSNGNSGRRGRRW